MIERVEDLPPKTCAGCHQPLADGQEQGQVTVTSQHHAITVAAHEGCRDAAHRWVMKDHRWKTDDIYYTG